MPAPGSEIPSSESVDFLTAISRAAAAPSRARALRAYEPSAPETEFKKRFASPFKVQAVTIYEAQRKVGPQTEVTGVPRSISICLARVGPINIPKGFYTDFASVPPGLHSVILRA